MNDIISREKLLGVIKPMVGMWNEGTFWIDYERVIDIIENLPSAESERTAKVSNQIFNNSNPYTVGAWIGTCECGVLVSYSSKYCHMCGARLEWK